MGIFLNVYICSKVINYMTLKIQLYGYISNIFSVQKRTTHGSKTFAKTIDIFYTGYLYKNYVAQDLGNNISVLNIIYSTVLFFF